MSTIERMWRIGLVTLAACSDAGQTIPCSVSGVPDVDDEGTAGVQTVVLDPGMRTDFGGCLEDATDVDTVAITLTGAVWVWASREPSLGADLELNDRPIATEPARFAAGTYNLRVAQPGPVGVPWIVHIGAEACATPDAPDHVEAIDGTGRGNDVIDVASRMGTLVVTDTPEIDAEEVVTKPLDARSIVRIDGTAVVNGDALFYADRDTYRLTRSPALTWVTTRLEWIPEAGDTPVMALMPLTQTENDYVEGVNELIGSTRASLDFVVWVAQKRRALTQPVSYRLTLCGFPAEP